MNMDHRAALEKLPNDLRAKLVARSDRAGSSRLALHVGSIVLTGSGIWFAVPFWPLLLLPHGILLVFLFTLAHECTHQTPFRTPWINEIVGHGIAPILALPFVWFRYFHLAHHRHTNHPDQDPELADGGRPDSRREWIVYLSGWRYWRGAAVLLWANARGKLDAPYLPHRRKAAMRREAQVILAVYAVALASLAFTPVLIWLWAVPVLIGQPFLRAYLLAEHGLCPPVADMLANSRTTFTTHLVRLLAWNMPYHAEHHAYPAVPFQNLPQLHAVLAPNLKSTSNGYCEFTADYLASLRHY